MYEARERKEERKSCLRVSHFAPALRERVNVAKDNLWRRTIGDGGREGSGGKDTDCET